MTPAAYLLEIKAYRSLNRPKNLRQARRRQERYRSFAARNADSPEGRIAQAEAARLGQFIETRRYGRGNTPGRSALERDRFTQRTEDARVAGAVTGRRAMFLSDARRMMSGSQQNQDLRLIRMDRLRQITLSLSEDQGALTDAQRRAGLRRRFGMPDYNLALSGSRPLRPPPRPR